MPNPACFVAGQWLLLREFLDDLGESNESLDRPALQWMLEGEIDQVVVSSFGGQWQIAERRPTY